MGTTRYINVNNAKNSKGLIVEGKIDSPGYPNNYPGGVSQTVYILLPKNTNIHLHFQNIDIEGRLDDRASTDGNPSKPSCMYDKLELAERLNDIDINLPLKENPS